MVLFFQLFLSYLEVSNPYGFTTKVNVLISRSGYSTDEVTFDLTRGFPVLSQTGWQGCKCLALEGGPITEEVVRVNTGLGGLTGTAANELTVWGPGTD